MSDPRDVNDRAANICCSKLLEIAMLSSSSAERFHSQNIAVQKLQPTVTRHMPSFQTARVHQPPLAAANRFLN